VRAFKRPFNSIEELHAERLECFRVIWHREIGVTAALWYCAANKVTVPGWAAEEAQLVLCNALRPRRARKRGRASDPVARYRQDMIDYARYEEVVTVREKQKEIPEQVEELRSLGPQGQSLLAERLKMLAWVGHTWLRAYECASMILAHTDACGGPETMKASYLEVARNSRDPRQTLRYHHLLDWSLLRSLGLDTRRPAKPKIVPLYELTL
jgi:hypothetical protein